MAFKKILPRVGKSSNSVRVSFTGNKTLCANIYFCKDVLEEVKWGTDDRVYVYCDDQNPKLWLIEQSDKEGVKESFKLVQAINNGSRVSKLQFRFSSYKPDEKEKKLKEVKYEIKDGDKILIEN